MGQQIFNVNGNYNWTCPTGVTSVQVEVWGSGGNGYPGTGANNAGRGGGGGAYSKLNAFVSTPGNVYPLFVPKGGGGAQVTFNTNSCTADSGSNATSGFIGGGGLSGNGIGDVKHSGGNGGDNIGNFTCGGGGGGAGGSTVNGGVGGAANNVSGGAGGNGGSVGGGGGGAGGNFPNGAGSNGTNPGGAGGGGGSTGGTKGLGTDGQVILTWTDPPTFPLLRQGNQQLYYDLPNFWQEWEAYDQSPYVQWFIPGLPKAFQPSQRWDALPIFDSWWEQFRFQPIPISYIPTNPWFIQPSQRWDALPDYWAEWQGYKQLPYGQTYIPPLPNSFQPSQRWDALPVFDTTWWEQFRPSPLPSSFVTAQAGTYGVQNVIFMVGQSGIYRVQNNIQGYNVYVGVNALPDLTKPPTLFAPALPISFPVSPGPSIRTFNILVRAQDTYGLESQNQFTLTILIDSSGNPVLPPLLAPQALKLVIISGNAVKVLAQYAYLNNDTKTNSAADTWLVFFKKDHVPVPGIDLPVVTVPVNGNILSTNLPPQVPGTYYAVVVLSRVADNTISPTLGGSITINPVPTEVIAVPSGFQGV